MHRFLKWVFQGDIGDEAIEDCNTLVPSAKRILRRQILLVGQTFLHILSRGAKHTLKHIVLVMSI